MNHITNDNTTIFVSYFNQPIDNLPSTITDLTFSYDFNQSVDNLSLSITN
jgi:hypothetical protein